MPPRKPPPKKQRQPRDHIPSNNEEEPSEEVNEMQRRVNSGVGRINLTEEQYRPLNAAMPTADRRTFNLAMGQYQSNLKDMQAKFVETKKNQARHQQRLEDGGNPRIGELRDNDTGRLQWTDSRAERRNVKDTDALGEFSRAHVDGRITARHGPPGRQGIFPGYESAHEHNRHERFIQEGIEQLKNIEGANKTSRRSIFPGSPSLQERSSPSDQGLGRPEDRPRSRERAWGDRGTGLPEDRPRSRERAWGDQGRDRSESREREIGDRRRAPSRDRDDPGERLIAMARSRSESGRRAPKHRMTSSPESQGGFGPANAATVLGRGRSAERDRERERGRSGERSTSRNREPSRDRRREPSLVDERRGRLPAVPSPQSRISTAAPRRPSPLGPSTPARGTEHRRPLPKRGKSRK